MTKKLKMGGGERYNIPAPQSRNVSKNQQQLNRQKTKDQNSQMKIVHKKKKEDMVITHPQLLGRLCKVGGRTKIFQIIRVGILAYQVPAYFLNLKLIRTMLVPNLVSHHHQVFFPNHQATGSLFPLILQIRK